MTYSSRDKLNSLHILGSIGIAALFAAIVESWEMFIIVAVALIGASLFTGELRPPKRRR